MTDLVAQNLSTALIVTFIGMAVVLAFLTLMIFAMDITSGLILNVLNKYFPEEVKEEKAKTKKKPANNDDEIALAVALAYSAKTGGR